MKEFKVHLKSGDVFGKLTKSKIIEQFEESFASVNVEVLKLSDLQI